MIPEKESLWAMHKVDNPQMIDPTDKTRTFDGILDNPSSHFIPNIYQVLMILFPNFLSNMSNSLWYHYLRPMYHYLSPGLLKDWCISFPKISSLKQGPLLNVSQGSNQGVSQAVFSSGAWGLISTLIQVSSRIQFPVTTGMRTPLSH